MGNPMEVRIFKKTFIDGAWDVDCQVTTGTTTRMGPHAVNLPETATDAEIENAILEMYQ